MGKQPVDAFSPCLWGSAFLDQSILQESDGSCCGIAELSGVMTSCEGFGAMIRCTASNYINWRHSTRYGGEFTSNEVVAGRKDVMVFVLGQMP